jgi:hypothetical protein
MRQYSLTEELTEERTQLEAEIIALLGPEDGKDSLTRSDNLPLAALEKLVAELLGVIIPIGGAGALVIYQIYIEIAMSAVGRFMKIESGDQTESALKPKSEDPYASTLNDVRLDVIDANKDSTNFKVVGEVNELMHMQRVDQLAAYLDELNFKAIRKRKILQGLIQMWQSTKLLRKKIQPSVRILLKPSYI